MKGFVSSVALAALLLLVTLAACTAGGERSGDDSQGEEPGLSVVADLSFLADIAQEIAGGRLQVTPLIPRGSDPHSFQATPSDAKRLAEADLVLINVAGLSPSLDELIQGAAESRVPVVEAAAGLAGVEEDPHVWLDPMNVKTYVKNILVAFQSLDPDGAEVFAANAERYDQCLQELHEWTISQVEKVPVERRLLVTEHESLGYFAERYGFTVVGAISPSTSGEGSPSARHLAELVEAIKRSGAPAVFVEAGSNGELARRVAAEAGVKLVPGLRLHSLDDEAPTYLDMMRVNVRTIVGALQ